jgi:uncharacterized protein (DUF1499 family)
MMDAIRSVLRFFETVGQFAAMVLLVAVVVGVVWFAWLGRKSRRMPPRLSPTGGPLRADGTNPNWVSTTARRNNPLHYIAPRTCPENPILRLEAYLRQGKYVVSDVTERYLHATQSSLRFGFTDDIEFFYDQASGLLHARSASRVGMSDFGVNRRRLEAIFTETGL